MSNVPPLYNKEIKCPLCEQSFTATKVRKSMVKVAGQDTDFKPLYASGQINPLLYNVHVCRHCGYSFTDDFSVQFPPGTANILRASVSEHWIEQNYSGERTPTKAIKSYKLALYSGVLKKEKHLTLAGLALRTAWIYRDLDQKKEEDRFLSIAFREYEEAFLSEDVAAKMSEVKVLYLLGELSRKLGNNGKAASFFSKVIEQRESTEKQILEMARDRWHELRENKKDQEETA
ncbi:DUF2225 domain-containing protein [Domibacillus epiphyticus]|uniref:DUF2225 domain-containing protein n=1 Tax=Domibacillus epiphyticus TaxID=1714355 RepID=A0A1V2A9Z2_9BACI|nr:DUF2225 domain-containing protein [Domibacillus epiphyticus]OMP67801.1 hypothetical protein BTO28_04765 [Domibacillus epiphyticus]